MKYNRLHINHFGKLRKTTIEFSDGINIIYGANESGKSTLHTFLEAMLFGMERGRGKSARQDIYTRYYPPEGGSTYGGVLEFTQGDTKYSLYRNFSKDPRGFSLLDETHSKPLAPTQEEYQKLISQLTLPIYRNTISVRQLQTATTNDFPAQLRNHIVNLRTAGSATLSIPKAKEHLKKERRRLEQSYSREADRKAAELEEQISQRMEEEKRLAHEGPDSEELEARKNELDQRVQQQSERHTALLTSIHEHEEFLRIHSGETEEVVREWEEESAVLTENRERFHFYYRIPMKGFLRAAFLFVSLLTFCVTAFAFWLCTVYMMNHQYLRGLLILLISIVSGTMFIRLSRIWDANTAYRCINQHFLDLYQKIFPDPPSQVTGENLREFLDILSSLQRRRVTLLGLRKEDEELTNQLLQNQQQVNELTAQLDQLKNIVWQRNQNAEALRSLEEAQDALASRLQQNQRLREEMSAIDLAAETIDELAVTAFDSFGTYLQGTASQLIHQITKGRYHRLLIDDDLHITLERDHTPVELGNLSCSTLDQVYLALRIACIEFFWPHSLVPLLLDESFAMYDNERITETLSWLAESYPGQVILFTCQHREEEILDKCQIPYRMIRL